MTTKQQAPIGDGTDSTAVESHYPGVIEPQALYSKEEFLRRVGLKAAGFRAATRDGLKVLHRHSRTYVLGSDWIAYVTRDDETGDDER